MPDAAVSDVRARDPGQITSYREGVEASRFAGITRQYVRQLEAGLSDPTVGTLQKLAKALGVPVTELLG